METRTIPLPPSPIHGLRTIELTLDHEPLVRLFYEENPEYFLATTGEPAGPEEARDDLRFELPPGITGTGKMVVGYVDDKGAVAALASMVVNMLAKGVWHIGLFIIATARHGSGDAHAIYGGLEDWARANGAEWMRLGVVQGHTRAERFWSTLGFQQTRTREVEMGKRINTVRAMVKPLAAGSMDEYLALVASDRPEGWGAR